ncbi:sialidase family protein, partial [Longimicrobium sp.]|uniref:sialidase family protein n=1 Tax=Longimicrobium sp. TaxID=2029185 RepID=UPI002E33D47A
MASSTRNPLHLLAGGNDYRTVDIPGLPEGRLVGDAWHGLFWSRDGGHEWSSTLLPGYPQDTSPEGLASPLRGLEAGADPVLRSGTNGLVYYAGIAFNRAAIPENAHGTGKEGKLFVARFIDDNAKETGNPFRGLGISIADHGDEERFLDKPWLAVDVPRAGAGLCVVPGSGEIGPQQFKGGHVYLSYTAVSGDASNLQTRILFTRSRDCGATWSTPVSITDGQTVDQGTVIAIHPLTGWVYVAWRRIDPVQRTAAFLLAISLDGGKRFSKPITIASLAPYTLEDGVTNVASVFEQGTSIVSFRTTGFPALTVDRLGIVYAAWSERGVGPGGDARIVVKRSPGGLFWWWPAEPANPSPERGHELMPSLLYHGGRILLVHYTLAEDHTVGILTPAGGGAFAETRQPAGDLAPPGADPTKVFREFVADTAPGGLKRRHTMDVWVREARPTLCDFSLEFTSSRRVSQYFFGDVGGPDAGTIKQLQFNPPNLPMYQCQGDVANCVAFIGDYVDVAGAAPFVPRGRGWTYNLDPRPAGTAHVIWTDNRDVRPPPPGKTWADYTPPDSPFSATLPPQSLFDPTQERPRCVPQAGGFTTAGMRNQNLYTSRVTAGLVAVSPQNAKPLGLGVLPGGETVLLQRSFVVVVQNTSDALRTFRLTIRNQPPDGPPTGKASFLQFPDPGLPDPLTELFVNVGARSSATRTVFVTSTQADASVTVDVQEATAPGGEVIPPEAGGLLATVVLNPDITNPDITNPDITNPDITNPDITNA